jgi:hypothetical protein
MMEFNGSGTTNGSGTMVGNEGESKFGQSFRCFSCVDNQLYEIFNGWNPD